MKNDFIEILQRLTLAKVDFVLIGGFAASTYGCTLVTEDIDICCDFSSANLGRLQKALDGLHPVHRMTPSRKPLKLTDDTVADLKNLYLETDLGILDCLGYVDGIGHFEQALKASCRIDSDGVILNILSLDALIQAKQALNRPRDQQAVIQLKAIREQVNRNSK